LDAEGIVLMVADGDLEVRKRDLAVERFGRRDPDVVELHTCESGATSKALTSHPRRSGALIA
jgi:hypothetical protein